MKCYICHKEIFDNNVHPFYKRMCNECGNANWAKRHEFVSLWGYTALVTGGRIKIGYETSLKLLRSGAFVVVTTRFPVDAAKRYFIESDFADWNNRLIIYQIDFRQIQNVYNLITFMYSNFNHLDILINNAAQTVRHTIDYYEELSALELHGYDKLPKILKKIIVRQSDTCSFAELQKSLDRLMYLHPNSNELVPRHNNLLNENSLQENSNLTYKKHCDSQQKNSWISKACDVSLIEMLEVQLINVTVPFALCTELRNLMESSPHKYRYIVNVSAMEGQFSKKNKNCYHPHTNMAKASLNMLTRTSAQEYFDSGIIMNSVDTGWITDENPDWLRKRNERKGLVPPLDAKDGASRLCDPIFSSILRNNNKHGLFYKDYTKTEW